MENNEPKAMAIRVLCEIVKDAQKRIESLEARVEKLEPIHFEGLEDLTVNVDEEFDPLDGVTAIGCNGTPAVVTVEVK